MLGGSEYRRGAHAVYDIKYHLIWITKYRYKVLRGRVAERARDLIRQSCQAREVVVIRGVVSPDHVHLLVSAPPRLAPSKLVQYLKGRSSRRLQDEFGELRKRYWGQHLWARSSARCQATRSRSGPSRAAVEPGRSDSRLYAGLHQQRNIDLRTAAFSLAIQRVGRAAVSRSTMRFHDF